MLADLRGGLFGFGVFLIILYRISIFHLGLSLFWYLTDIDAEALKDYFEWQETRTLAYFFLAVLSIFSIAALTSCPIMYIKDCPQIY